MGKQKAAPKATATAPAIVRQRAVLSAFTDAAKLAEEGEEFEVFDELGAAYEPPFLITVVGVGSRSVRIAQQLNAGKVAASTLAATPKPGETAPPIDEEAYAGLLIDGQIETLARATRKWTLCDDDGVTLVPCTVENCRTLYTAASHIANQVARKVYRRRTNFRAAD